MRSKDTRHGSWWPPVRPSLSMYLEVSCALGCYEYLIKINTETQKSCISTRSPIECAGTRLLRQALAIGKSPPRLIYQDYIRAILAELVPSTLTRGPGNGVCFRSYATSSAQPRVFLTNARPYQCGTPGHLCLCGTPPFAFCHNSRAPP